MTKVVPLTPQTDTSHRPILTVDLDAVAHNYRFMRDNAHGARVGGVIKANGYGCGALDVAETLVEEGADLLFVSTPEEAADVRAQFGDVEICTLNGFPSGSEQSFLNNSLLPCLNILDEVYRWADFNAAAGRSLPCALHVDTGMNRLGLGVDEFGATISDADLMARLNVQFVMSHLACADEPDHPLNEVQRKTCDRLFALTPKLPASLANSAGILNGANYRFQIVRPGVALYGGQPKLDRNAALKPVVSLKAPILQIREIDKPASVGYGATHKASGRSLIATIGVGYADGYMRHLSNAGSAWFDGKSVPIVGRVSMDLTTFDISAVSSEAAKVGALVELLGENITVDDVADAAGTVGYEILTSLGQRYERRTIRGGKIVLGA